MRVRDGRLVLPDGMSYRLLVLPPGETMTPVLLAKIKELVEAGATVVGPRPGRSPSLSDYPGCDRQVERLAARLWGDCDGKKDHRAPRRRGQDRLGQDARNGAGRNGHPARLPMQVVSRRDPLHPSHGGRNRPIFRRQRRSRALDARCTFRVSGKRPEFWHPDTGWGRAGRRLFDDDRETQDPDLLGPLRLGVRGISAGRGMKPTDGVVSLTRNGQSIFPSGAERPSAARIAVERATYGVPGNPKRTRDVTSLFVGSWSVAFRASGSNMPCPASPCPPRRPSITPARCALQPRSRHRRQP